MTPVEWRDDDVTLRLRVQPRSSRDELAWQGEQLKLWTTAPPVDGKANQHICRYLARLFGVARGQVELLSGEIGRDKRIRIRQPRKIPDALQAESRNAPR